MSENKSKMYILILDDPAIDLGHRILTAAHASLSGYLTFVESELNSVPEKDRFVALGGRTSTEQWAKESFRKVVCKVTKEEFEKAKTYGENMKDYRIMVESGLGSMDVAIVFRPRDNFEPFFRSLKLYK